MSPSHFASPIDPVRRAWLERPPNASSQVVPYLRDGNPDEAEDARAEPGETNAAPGVARGRSPRGRGRRAATHLIPMAAIHATPARFGRPRAAKRERADDEQHHHSVVMAATAEVERQQRIPAHECRSERAGTGGERRCEDRGAEYGNRG